MSTTEYIVNQYGPLLTYQQLAELLGRSVSGLRWTLTAESEKEKTWVKKINNARVKIGRRIHFKTSAIAELIEEGLNSE